MALKSLDEIARELAPAPDKALNGHGYTRVYDALLAPWRKRPLTLLEIGVWQGASLRMWRAYFTHPQARILGVDIDLSNYARRETDAFEVIQADASDPAHLAARVAPLGPFDVVIDDGSHQWHHQRLTFGALWGALKPGGWYIVEDVQTSYWHDPPRGEGVTFVEWAKSLVDEVNGRGKTARAALENATPDELAQLTPLERAVQAVRFERYMVLIQRRE
jgi:hypothetical protein